MAEPTRAKKVSRRRAMAILGSGAAVGAVWESVELKAISCSEPAQAQIIRPPKVGTAPRRGTTPPRIGTPAPKPENGVFYSVSCCEETKAAILSGAQASAIGKAHLRPITDQLTQFGSDGLEEYCLMIWGVNKDHRDELLKTMKERASVWYGR